MLPILCKALALIQNTVLIVFNGILLFEFFE